MNHLDEGKMTVYMGTGVRKLSDEELREYADLVDTLDHEITQERLIRQNTPINTPTGSPV